MKKLLSPPYVTGYLSLIFFLMYYFSPSDRQDLFFYASYLSGFLLSITIHELGHVLFGLNVGHRFLYFTTGPLTLEKSANKIRIVPNVSWIAFGGTSMMLPSSFEKEKMIKNEILYAIGGPLFSLSTSIISYLLYSISNYSFFSFFALMNMGLFLITIFPTAAGSDSDGYIIQKLWKRDKESMLWIDQMIRSKKLSSPLRPKQWNKESISAAKNNPTDSLSAVMVYYYEIDTNNFNNAREVVLNNFELQIPDRVDIKLAYFTQMSQLNLFFNKKNELEKIKRLQEKLSPLEVITYERGKAMIAFLESDVSKAKLHLQKSDDFISHGIKNFGFFYAEAKLNKLVRTEIDI